MGIPTYAADGKTKVYSAGQVSSTPLMVRAVDFNALHAECEKLRKDAERYLRLRNGQNWPAAFACHDAPEPLRGVDLDAALDGAA